MISPKPIAARSFVRRPLVRELVVCGDFRICFPPEPHLICFAVLEPGLPVFAIQTCAAISVLLSFRIIQGRLGDLALMPAFLAFDQISPMPLPVTHANHAVLRDCFPDGISAGPRFVVHYRETPLDMTRSRLLPGLRDALRC